MAWQPVHDPPPCDYCGQRLTRDGDGWSCQDRECDRFGYVRDRPAGVYCAHGFTPLGQTCSQCNPLRR